MSSNREEVSANAHECSPRAWGSDRTRLIACRISGTHTKLSVSATLWRSYSRCFFAVPPLGPEPLRTARFPARCDAVVTTRCQSAEIVSIRSPKEGFKGARSRGARRSVFIRAQCVSFGAFSSKLKKCRIKVLRMRQSALSGHRCEDRAQHPCWYAPGTGVCSATTKVGPCRYAPGTGVGHRANHALFCKRMRFAYAPPRRLSIVCPPSSTTLPCCMTAILSAPRMVLSRCATITVVRPFMTESKATCGDADAVR